jgi:uncharacterized protein (TIGR03084 family)
VEPGRWAGPPTRSGWNWCRPRGYGTSPTWACAGVRHANLAAPDRPVRVALTAPDGGTWAWGPDGAADQVSGPALDFCLTVTQRRNLADTGLVITGPAAADWMGIAQAFAGPPGPGRPRRS